MTDYKGPERRAVITFTREDSDRLVRLEGQNLTTLAKMDTILEHIEEVNTRATKNTLRIEKLEKLTSWFMGIGAAVTFIISSAILWLKH